MQSAAFALSPSAPLLKLRTPSRSRPNPNTNPRFHPIAALSSSLRPKPISIHGTFSPLAPHSRPHSPLSSSLLPPPSDREVVARSAAGGSSGGIADEKSGGNAMLQTLQLGALFGLWYLFNIYFNIYNKQVLKVFPYPMTMTTVQFAVGTVLIIFMWTTNLYKRPKISSSQLVAILPLAIVHTMGNLFTNMSLGKVAVSFTHTIKAMEPFFSVLLSALFLGEILADGAIDQLLWTFPYFTTFIVHREIQHAMLLVHPLDIWRSWPWTYYYNSSNLLSKMPTPWVVLSLMPIVGGVALASMTEASFNWAGFWSAMASNVTFQSRNVLSKKVMVKKEESMDNINLFSIITIMSFFLLTPVTLFVEGTKFTPAFVQSAGLNLQQVYTRSLVAGLCFHAYQQVSYMILARVSPVTHSVGNCVKRVVVIVTSVLFFRTPVSPINTLGTGVALAGVFLYSRLKRIKPKTA